MSVNTYTFPSEQIERLFNEYVKRYYELQKKKRLEARYFIIILTLGMGSMLLPWMNPVIGIYIALLFWMLFYIVLKKYLKVKDEVHHLFVNVNVLYHHFLGRLEVGFCNHEGQCSCATHFKRYAMWKYGISFSEERPS